MSSSESKKWVCVRKVMLALSASLVLLFACLPAFSQGGLGTINGTITSAQGGPVAGATVSVIDVGRGETRPIVTDAAGLYAAAGLTPGAFTVRVEAKGFKTMEHTGITLTVGATLVVDFAMQPGAESEIVTITAEVLPANASSTVDNKAISETPVNGRNFVNLVENRNTGQTTQPGGASNSRTSNGMRTDQNNPLIDGLYDGDIDTGWQNVNGFGFQGGIDPDILMPLDAIGEISSNGFPTAQYGWHLGNVTNIGIKSGTNSLHGTAYAFGRDADLDTRNPLRPPPGSGLFGAGKPPFAFSQWGASLGGKVRKDKLFYFANFEKEAFSVSQTQQISPPTTADLSGNNTSKLNASSSIPDAIYDVLNNHGASCTATNTTGCLSQVELNMAGCGNLVLNGTFVPNGGGTMYSGVVPTGYVGLTAGTPLSTIAANCAAPALPSSPAVPGVCSGTTHCFSVWGNNTPGINIPFGKTDVGGPDSGIAKMDYHASKQHSFNGEFYYGLANAVSERSGDLSPQTWWLIDSKIQMDIGRAVWVWTPNSSIVNEARFGADWVSEQAIASDCAGLNGAPNYINLWGFNSGTSTTCEMPLTSVTGLANLSFSPGAGPYVSQPRNYMGIDTVSWTRGKHVFKFGGEIRRGLFTGSGGGGTGPPIRGTLTFGNTNAFSNVPGQTATALEDLLTGSNGSATTFFGPGTTSQVRANYYAGFIQDTIRLNRKTTIDAGLRYEFQPAYYQPQNLESTVNFSFESGLGQETSGQPLYHQDTWRHNFSPRLAVAYDVFGNGKTVVRAGGGIMYAMTTYSGFSGMQNNPTGATFFAPTGASTAALPCTNTYPVGSPAATLDAGLCGFTNPYCNFSAVGGTTGNVGCINQGTIATSSALNFQVCNTALPNGINCGANSVTPPNTSGCPASEVSTGCGVFSSLLSNGVAGLRCGDGLPTTVNGTVSNPSPCTVYTVNPNLYIPYVTNWTASLQQALGKSVSLNVIYVGNHGTAIRQQVDLNQPAPGIAGVTSCPTSGPEAPAAGTLNVYCANNLQARTPFTTNCAPGVIPAPAGTQYALFAGTTSGPCAPWLGQVLEVANSDVSNYDAVLATLSLRGYHGFSGNLNYSLQHCMDIFSGNENIWTLLSDTRDPRLDYSTCAGGTPNRITANWNWNLPSRKSFAQMLQGWSVNSTVSLLPQRYDAVTDTKDQISGVITPGVTSVGSERWDIFGTPHNIYGFGGNSNNQGSLAPCYGWVSSGFTKAATNGCNQGSTTESVILNGTPYNIPVIGPQGICTADALTLPNSPASALVPSGTVTVANGASPATFPANSAIASLAALGCYVINGTVMLPPAQGSFGDMSKNCCLAPGYFQMDLSVTKSWGFLREQRLKMQFRVEMFNVFNHTNYTTPGLGLGTPSTFGAETASLNSGSQVVTGVGGERQVQLGLKFIW